MKKDRKYFMATLMCVACLVSLGVQAAPRSTPVTVVNDAATPVPVTGSVDATVSGDVNVTNGPSNPVSVSTGTNYRFVGPSSTATYPNLGLNGMNAVCATDHGSNARMCTTEEFFNTPGASIPHAQKIWILPKLTSSYYDPILGKAAHIEHTGLHVEGVWMYEANCVRWVSGASIYDGLAITASGSRVYAVTTTCADTHQVACCLPQ